MKRLHCRDLGFDCEGVIQAQTEEDILRQAAQHAKEVHNFEATPELVEQVKGKIQEA